MNWCLLLAAMSIACPWTRNTSRTYYWTEPTPVYVTCQPMPVCTYPSTMVCSPVVAEVVEENQAVESVKAEETIANATGEEDPEEDALEFAGYSVPSAYAGGDMALDWGVATIGAGTLFPNPNVASGGGAGFFGFPQSGNNGGGDFFPLGYPTIINNNIINNFGPGTKPPGPQPIPEPFSILVWLVGLAGFAAYRFRRWSRA